jgi:hypothetical protein
MLNKYMKVLHGVNLNDCILIKDFVKGLERKHLITKSKVFSMLDITNFLSSSDDFVMKYVLVVGVFGLLRISELTNICFNDVVKEKSHYSFFIGSSKTDQAKKGVTFLVEGEFQSVIDEYINLFPKKSVLGASLEKPEPRFQSEKTLSENILLLSQTILG